MPDDLDSIGRLGVAMAMMKIEALCLPRFEQFKLTAQLPIVISRYDDRFAEILHPFEQLASFNRRSLVVDQIAENDQPARPVFRDQLEQPLRDRRHPPERNKPARRALAQFVAEMQVRHGEPALALMKERKTAIEQDFVGDERLVGTE